MKSRFNFTAFILFIVAIVTTFSLLALVKVLQPQVTLYDYLNRDFYILLSVVLLSGLLTKKFYFNAKSATRKTASNRIYLSATINLIVLLFIKFAIYPLFYGHLFLIYFVLLLTLQESIFVYLYYAIVRSRHVGSDSYIEIEKTREEKAKNYAITPQTKTEIVQNFLANRKIFNWINKQADLESNKTAIFATSTNLSIELLPCYASNAIINLRRVNDITRINKFFELINEKLPDNSIFISFAETIEGRNAILLKKYIFPVNRIALFFDFVINRIFPKIKLTQDLYFSYTKGRNRALSKTELLGRLYSCGFELVNSTVINNRFIFCVKKVKNPIYDNNPTYGPFVALRRVGKDGKIVGIYKLRTMYPYAEYIQKYVYDLQGTSNGDKAEDDFRITNWGRLFRKFWLDELPMFINLIKRDVKIVGVRPLSKTKFETYPIELQEKRIKSKPGLVPPFYADMPKTQDELFDSEDRYLEAYFKSPFLTDFRYFWKAFYNIVFKKARSK